MGLFAGEPQVDEKAGRTAIMTDQVAHQYVYHVIIETYHGCTDY